MKTFKQISDTHIVRQLLLMVPLVCLIAINANWLSAQDIFSVSIQAPASASRDKVRQMYSSQIGIREKHPNSGPAVDEYLRYVGLSKGNPWCAAFVCWVLGKAGVENPMTGWSPGLFPAKKVIWDRAESPHLISYIPQTADVFGIYFPEKGRIAHAGFVD